MRGVAEQALHGRLPRAGARWPPSCRCGGCSRPADFDRPARRAAPARLGVEQIDFYLLHSLDDRHLGAGRWRTGQLASARASSRSTAGSSTCGFSFHGDATLFADAFSTPTTPGLSARSSYNYMDEDVPCRSPRAEACRRERPGGDRHGTVARRPAGRNGCRRRWQAAGARRRCSAAGRVGAAVGLEPARGDAGAQRHEHHGAGRAEPGVTPQRSRRAAERR